MDRQGAFHFRSTLLPGPNGKWKYFKNELGPLRDRVTISHLVGPIKGGTNVECRVPIFGNAEFRLWNDSLECRLGWYKQSLPLYAYLIYWRSLYMVALSIWAGGFTTTRKVESLTQTLGKLFKWTKRTNGQNGQTDIMDKTDKRTEMTSGQIGRNGQVDKTD